MLETDLDDLPSTPASTLLAAIDQEQNQLLAALDELNLKIEQALKEHGASLDTKPAAMPITKAA